MRFCDFERFSLGFSLGPVLQHLSDDCMVRPTHMSLVLCVSIEIIMVVTLLCATSDAAVQQDDADKIVERSVEVLKRDWAAPPRFDCSEQDKDKNGIRRYEDIMLDG